MIHRTINPERMERLQKQIEEIVAKSLAAEQRQRSRPERPRTPETPERPRTAEAPDRPGRPATPRGAGSGRGTSQGDLERRLDKLEEKMDRLLQTLESRQKSGESKR